MKPDELAAYCARIGLAQPLMPDLATLHAIHAAHCAAIPFENLDVQLGLAPSLDPDAIFAKLVTHKRGGWCYEVNGLLARALTAIGYRVRRICAGVVRDDLGRVLHGSHLALRVDLDEPWLIDTGFGSWIGAPIPLRPGTLPLKPWPITMSRLPDGAWHLRAELRNRTMAYQFADAPADEALMAQMCTWQAHSGDSIFVQNLVAQRRIGETDLGLRGRVLLKTDADGRTERLLTDADDLVTTLRESFGLDVPAIVQIWPAVVARHAALFPDQEYPTT